MEARKTLLLIVSTAFLKLYLTLADDLYCNVTQTPEGALYQVNQTDANQEFFWENDTNHELAADDDLSGPYKTEQVLSYNKTHLLLKVPQKVHYRTRNSKGDRHTATCTPTFRQEQRDPAGAGRTWIYCGLGVLLVLVLVVIVIIVHYNNGLQDRLRHICRRLGFSEVPKEDEHNEVDTEAARG